LEPLEIWSALGEVFPDGAQLRCWNHRLTNVIDHLPKKEWSAAKELLHKMPYALSRAECEQLRDQFAARYRKLCPKAVETLSRDWERMVTFYRFPKDHWIHLGTTNPVESPFSAVRLRTDAARRYKKVANAEALIWKILMIAEKKFRRLNSPNYSRQFTTDNYSKTECQCRKLTRSAAPPDFVHVLISSLIFVSGEDTGATTGENRIELRRLEVENPSGNSAGGLHAPSWRGRRRR